MFNFIGVRSGSFTPEGSSTEIHFKKASFITTNKDGSHWYKEVKLTDDSLKLCQGLKYGETVQQLLFDEYGRCVGITK